VEYSDETSRRKEHEAGLSVFVVPRRRTRFRESLQSERRRGKLRMEFAHFEHNLDPRYATLHEMHVKHDAHVDQIYALLTDLGAPATCFVLSDDDLDGKHLPLRDAVEGLMWAGAGFVSCLPGRLASRCT
jgi:hypothetical protein